MIIIKENFTGINNILSIIDGVSSDKPLGSQIIRTAALNAMSDLKDRIVDLGRSTDGGSIGSYSEKPIYISKDATPKSFGRPLGKRYKGKRRSKFKSTGKDHKSRYFSGGYKEFKSAIGRNSLGRVNLSLTGNMMNSLILQKTSSGWGIGWLSANYARRAAHFENKYGKRIFYLSSKEKKAAINSVSISLKNVFNRKSG